MQIIELINTSSQQLVTVVSQQTCTVKVRWQPSDSCWYADFEFPSGTPLVQGRRIVLDGDLMAHSHSEFKGTVVCRAIVENAGEPGWDCWNITHALVYEPP